jgi:hypothetical protein
MLNAILGDVNEIQQGVMGNTPTDEDEARWGTRYQQAPIEPNQLVWVVEARGDFTSNLDEDGNLPEDEDIEITIDNADDSCITYWRVVNCVSYTDENDVPYYEVSLESQEQAIIDKKFDPMEVIGVEYVTFYDKEYYDDMLEADARRTVEVDGMTGEGAPSELSPIALASDVIIENKEDYLGYFFYIIANLGYDFGEPGSIALEWIPCVKTYQKGLSVWQIIEDICGFNGYMVRYKRDKSCIVWNASGSTTASSSITTETEDVPEATIPDNEDLAPLGEKDVGAFGKGIKFTYSKEGVCDTATVTGYIGTFGEDGVWLIDEQAYKSLTIVSEAAQNILNGQHVETTIEIDSSYRLPDVEMLKNYGKKELFKTILGARGASCDSDSFPLSIEVGMSLLGSSKIGGTTNILVTSLNRTTDAQQNTVTTSITGTVLTQSGASGEENTGQTTTGWT